VNELEKITDPAIGQGLLNSCRGIAGTQFFIAYMRVGYALIASCRMRIQGYDGIEAVITHLCQTGDVQLDLEFAQIHTFELNRLGCDC